MTSVYPNKIDLRRVLVTFPQTLLPFCVTQFVKDVMSARNLCVFIETAMATIRGVTMIR